MLFSFGQQSRRKSMNLLRESLTAVKQMHYSRLVVTIIISQS